MTSKKKHRLPWPVFICGTLILAACSLSFFPMLLLVQCVLNTPISTPFVLLLKTSQWMIGLTLIAGFLIGPLLLRLPGNIKAWGSKYSIPICVASTLLLTYLTQRFLFDNIPHITDAISALFQAKIFASGHLAAKVPTCFEAFRQDNVLMLTNGNWVSKYPPGHALLLAIFLRIHAIQLWGLTCSALSIAAIGLTIQKCYDKKTAALTSLLIALSPLYILLGASYMSHTTFLLFLSVACLLTTLLIQAPRSNKKTPIYALSAGLCLGMATITRPQDLLMLIPTGIAILFLLPRKSTVTLLRCTPALIFGTLPPLLFMLYWNQQVFGKVFSIGYGASSQTLYPVIREQYGFSSNFTFIDACRNLFWSLFYFNRVLFGWPTSFFFLPFCLFFRATRNRKNLTCLLATLSIIIGYFPYGYYQRFEFEARYYYLTVPFLAVLSSEGLLTLYLHIKDKRNTQRAISLVSSLLVAFFLYCVFYYWPEYLTPIYGHDLENASPVVHEICEDEKLNNAIVFIPSTGKNIFRYSCGFIYNSPNLSDNIIYAKEDTSLIPCLKKEYKSRNLYRFIPQDNWEHGAVREQE